MIYLILLCIKEGCSVTLKDRDQYLPGYYVKMASGMCGIGDKKPLRVGFGLKKAKLLSPN